jgi:hypothetical protein
VLCPQAVARNERASAYWTMFIANVAPGQLTPIDAPLLGRLCMCLAYADDANERIEATGLMVKAPNTGLPIQSPFMAVMNRQTELARKLSADLALPPAQRNRMGSHAAGESVPAAWDAWATDMRGKPQAPSQPPGWRTLRGQHGFEPFLDQLLTNSGDCREAGTQRRGDWAVAPSFAGLPDIGLQQDACPGQLSRGVPAAADQRVQPRSLFRAERHHILLYGNLFRDHESAPSLRYGAIDSNILPIVNDVRQ